MSQWTHIRGSIRLDSALHEFKGKKNTQYGSKDAYLPFPEEQVKVLMPESYIVQEEGKEDSSGLRFRCDMYSLPRARKYIEKAFDLLPQGESGWSYAIHQDSRNYYSSSSSFDYPCDEKAFEKAIEKMYASENPWDNRTFKELKRFEHVELVWVKAVSEIIIGISEDIRDCNGYELLEGLENFFTYLLEHSISISDGYLEWNDEWNDNCIYAWRVDNYIKEDEDYRHRYSFYKLDKKTNKIIWSKSYYVPYLKDENGEIVWNDRHTYKKLDYNSKESDIIEKNY